MDRAVDPALHPSDPARLPRAVFFDVGDTLVRGGEPLSLVPDAEASLARLEARGIALGVISNWDASLDSILERLGLRRHFAVVLASGVVGVGKPSRKIFDLALAAVGARCDEAWHVGDDPGADAIGARRAGLSALLLDPYDLYPRLDAHGIVRAHTLTEAVDRILAGPPAGP